ncbi:hypothetical protein AB0C69_23500 [Actinomadura sp. NPDC048032]|uniref:hypothetical protein n=1 Tax=Actinomadura sp. NPDC048032 TaxID=3155747 RepID=UPI0033D40840
MAAFDICDFSSGAPRLMLHKRYTMYQVIQEAAGAAELSWTDCEREDRGDGFFLLAPPGYSVHSLIISLAPEISTRLRQINKGLPAKQQLRLRMAVHDGELTHDDHGVVSPDLNLLFRLLNAPALRARFEQGDFALIVSDDVYERVIEWDIAMIERRDFTPLPVELTNPGRPGPNGKDEKPVHVAYASLPPQPDPGPIDRSAHHEGPDVHAQLEQLVQRMQDLLDDDPPS